jgi:hypothetical protein
MPSYGRGRQALVPSGQVCRPMQVGGLYVLNPETQQLSLVPANNASFICKRASCLCKDDLEVQYYDKSKGRFDFCPRPVIY